MSPVSSRPVADLGYAEALSELEAILRELEGAAVDVDHLTDQVLRARALIARCRERISEARLHVEQVVAQPVDAPSTDGTSTDPTGRGSH